MFAVLRGRRNNLKSGAERVAADAFDAASVKVAIARVRPEAIIDEWNSLSRH
jgi:hypothetical protein